MGTSASKARHSPPIDSLDTPREDIMDNSPFKKLAPELRNRIYELVFDEEGATVIEIAPFRSPAKIVVGGHALTQTCKQIRQESLQMFIQKNEFNIVVYPPLPEGIRYRKADPKPILRWAQTLEEPPAIRVDFLRPEIAETKYYYALGKALSTFQKDFKEIGLRPKLLVTATVRGYENAYIDSGEERLQLNWRADLNNSTRAELQEELRARRRAYIRAWKLKIQPQGDLVAKAWAPVQSMSRGVEYLMEELDRYRDWSWQA